MKLRRQISIDSVLACRGYRWYWAFDINRLWSFYSPFLYSCVFGTIYSVLSSLCLDRIISSSSILGTSFCFSSCERTGNRGVYGLVFYQLFKCLVELVWKVLVELVMKILYIIFPFLFFHCSNNLSSLKLKWPFCHVLSANVVEDVVYFVRESEIIPYTTHWFKGFGRFSTCKGQHISTFTKNFFSKQGLFSEVPVYNVYLVVGLEI